MASLPDCSVTAGASLFEALYAEHKSAVHSVALRLLGDREDAEEVTQETFLNAYRALADGTSPNEPRAWLLAIARNACRARWRKSGYPVREVPLGDELGVASGEGETLEAGEVRTALERLLPNHRIVIVLRELFGMSFGEIATRLGRSESAVHTLLFRARVAMREELEAARSPLSCGEAEILLGQRRTAITRLDRSLLRAHLRHCAACEVEARRRRARAAALGLVVAPLKKLGSWLGVSATSAPGAKIGALLGAAALVGVATQSGPIAISPPEGPRVPGAALASSAGLESKPLPARLHWSSPARLDGGSGQASLESPRRVDGPQSVAPPPAEPNPAEPGSAHSRPDTPVEVARGTARLAGPDDGGAPAPGPKVTRVVAPESEQPLVDALAGIVAGLPALTVPELTLPEVTLPEVTLPEVTLPELTVPEAIMPALPVSTEPLLAQLPSLD